MSKFLCICLSATIQRTVSFELLMKARVNRTDNYRTDASGKAVNSARVINQLSPGDVKVVCPLGARNKDQFLFLAASDELPVSYVTIPGFTRECWTLLDRGDKSTTELVVDEAFDGYDAKNEQEALFSIINKEMEDCDAVLLAGSRPKIWQRDVHTLISAMAKKKGKILLADYAGEALETTLCACTPDIIKINEEEYMNTFEGGYLSPSELKTSIIKKSKELNNIIVVTRGTSPTYASCKGDFLEFPVEKVKAVNTTACGDSFSGGFLYEYVTSGDFASSIAKGTWCASRNAESMIPGTIKDY